MSDGRSPTRADDENSPLFRRPAANYASISAALNNPNPTAVTMPAAEATSTSKQPSQVHTGELLSSAPPETNLSAGADPTVGPGVGTGLGLGPIKSDTDLSWGAPAGLPLRRLNDENLVIFRRAVGINSTLAGSTDPESLEEGRKKAVGIYRSALTEVRRKQWMYWSLSVLINASHFAQIIIGASLTALGPTAGEHVLVITLLGAVNTVLAGVLALIKGQGLPDRLYHHQAEYRRLQDWIEQTEALLAVGVVGRDRKEVGVLVQTAFKKYNAAKQCEENNLPENYIRQPESDQDAGPVSRGSATPPVQHGRSPSPYHH